jgi:phosphatidylglycerophosphate synthase
MSEAANRPAPPAESYRQTVARLASAQKKAARGAPPYSIYINRRVGRYLAAWAYRVGLTPNGVTTISAIFTFSGIAVLALTPSAWWVGIVVWLLLAIGYAFDSADGQVARLRGGGSLAGEWLDHVVDCIKISTLHLAVLITAFLHFGLTSPAWLLVPLGYSVVNAVAFFAMILNDQLKSVNASRAALRAGVAPPAASAHNAASVVAEADGRSALRSLLLVPTDYGFLCIVFVLVGFPIVFMVVYSLMFLANLIFLIAALIKWFRDMKALDSDRSGAS